MQTKKTFIATAARLKSEMECAASPAVKVTLERLAYSFAETYGRENPRFDRERFLKACGVTLPDYSKRVIEGDE